MRRMFGVKAVVLATCVSCAALGAGVALAAVSDLDLTFDGNGTTNTNLTGNSAVADVAVQSDGRIGCGATPLAERAFEELQATGARPRKLLRGGLESLTPSERRVARMAADGLQNKEIAQTLFVTVRTVETHLRHVYQKLDIGSREQLAGTLVSEDAGVQAPV